MMERSDQASGSVSLSSTRAGGYVRELAWRGYIARAAAGATDALAALYDESSPMVYALALRILGNAADAEEVTLDVYSQVWKSAGSFDGERGSVTTWLTMLARSRAIDRFRSRQRTRIEHPMDEAPVIADAGPDPEQASAEFQQRQRVRMALAALPAEQRELLELAYFSGLSQAELAERLGLPLGTVKTRMRLGLMKLRQTLQGPAVSVAGRML